MPSNVLPFLFTLAVFLAALPPLLLITRPPDDDGDEPPGPPEPVPFDHPLTFERAIRGTGGDFRLHRP